MSSFLPAPKFPWGRLTMLKGDEFRRPEPVTPTWNILDSVLSQRLFKQRDQSSCTSMLRVQSFSLPSPRSLKGFNGSQFKNWLLFNPTSCCDSFNSPTHRGALSMWEFQSRSPTFKDLDAGFPGEQDSTSVLTRAGPTGTHQTVQLSISSRWSLLPGARIPHFSNWFLMLALLVCEANC